jgi:hypothetical protein
VHKKLSIKTCDLKISQDALVHTFFLDNCSQDSDLLEIERCKSRIITAIKKDCEIWNLDKLEGSGFGSKKREQANGFHLVHSDIGEFFPDLPTSYFDLVFSISTIEHIAKSPELINDAIDNFHLLLKPADILSIA